METITQTMEQAKAAMETLFGPQADQLAKQSGAIRRHRKLSGRQLAAILTLGYWQDGQATREALAQMAQVQGVSISAPALQQHLTQATSHFLEALLALGLRQVVASEPVAVPLLERFAVVWLEDSSQLSLPQELAQRWQATGNQHTRQVPAGLKLHTALDLRSGQLWGPQLSDGRTADTQSPLREIALPPGSLRLRDRGYWQLDGFASWTLSEQYWISYVKFPLTLLDERQERLDLLKVLVAQREPVQEYAVLLGARTQVKARLIAVRVPDAVIEQRQQLAQHKATQHGRRLSAVQQELARWVLIVTNVPVHLLSSTEAVVLLRVRWQLELFYKLCKSDAAQLDQWRARSPWAILCEVYAKLLGILLQHWLLLVGSWEDPFRSWKKTARFLRTLSHELARALGGHGSLLAVLQEVRRCLADGQGSRVTKRRQRPSTAQQLFDGLDWAVT
ncbi:MAG TPA: IS4 family transposase [Ktedonobacteraceae bacterium]|nr:IS4 family transposase [Ktedonobacteraceae bacterium]